MARWTLKSLTAAVVVVGLAFVRLEKYLSGQRPIDWQPFSRALLEEEVAAASPVLVTFSWDQTMTSRRRWWEWLVVGWVCSAILCAEWLGYPHVYGWPLWIAQGDGAPPPPAWVILVDVLSALVAVAATLLVAGWRSRGPSGRFQFRLSTLMALVAVVAVLLGAWRANIQFLDELSFQPIKPSGKLPFMVVMVDLTCEYGWRPTWIRGPIGLFIRLGVLLGLACMIYSAGQLAIHIVMKHRHKRRPESPR